MLRGEYVVLRTPDLDDVDIITAWQNDRDAAKYLPFIYPLSKKDQENAIRHMNADESSITFIVENEDEVPLGLCSLKNIDWVNGTSEINIALYAKNCWGRGYGYDILRTLTNFGMDEINLYTIYANILEGNERAVKCFEKAGYEIEGILFNRYYKEGRYRNVISMCISKGRKIEGQK